MAWLQRQLSGTRAKVAHGDLAGADADLSRMRARLAATDDLRHGQRTALEARIAALEAAVARAQDRAKDVKKEHGTPGAGPAVTPGPRSTETSEPSNTKTPDPQNSKANQPQNTKAPEPGNTTEATAGSTETTPGPASIQAPQPKNTKKATSQQTKEATPPVGPGAASTEVEQPSSADSHGSAKAERPTR